MKGTNHSVMGLVTLGFGVSTGYFLLSNNNIPQQVRDGVIVVKDFLLNNGDIPVYIFYPFIFVLYLFGCMLPDIDSPYSRIGKVIHLPVKHRTWTHAIYIPVILLITGIWIRSIFWLGLGYLLHLICDSFSLSGINWFYPRKHKHHIFKLYRTSHTSETIVVTTYAVLFVVYCIFVLV